VKALFFISLLLLLNTAKAQGPYAPAAGELGSTAIHMDSTVIADWASVCTVQRGWLHIADTNLGKASVGEPHFALGKANANGVVSLGDGGEAIIRFNGRLFDGQGADFAIFENSFSDTFLELAFVEVSSDGRNFFRFPAHSLSDTAAQVGGFGAVDPTNVHNLAGKYHWSYGTPFDLADLAGTPGLDLQQISHIKIIDVVGSLDSAFSSRDSEGRLINDPYPTPFPSGGFDLDGVAAIHISSVGLDASQTESKLKIYPNPVLDRLIIETNHIGFDQFEVIDFNGRVCLSGDYQSILNLTSLTKGYYLLRLIGEREIVNKRIVKQ